MTGKERLELALQRERTEGFQLGREVHRLRQESARHYHNHLEAERNHASFKRAVLGMLGLEFDADDRALEAIQRRIMELTVKGGER
jgi:hypothetical protein